jgi:hypothetical protein
MTNRVIFRSGHRHLNHQMDGLTKSGVILHSAKRTLSGIENSLGDLRHISAISEDAHNLLPRLCHG